LMSRMVSGPKCSRRCRAKSPALSSTSSKCTVVARSCGTGERARVMARRARAGRGDECSARTGRVARRLVDRFAERPLAPADAAVSPRKERPGGVLEEGVRRTGLEEEQAAEVRAAPRGVRPVQPVEVLRGEGERCPPLLVTARPPVRRIAGQRRREPAHVLFEREVWCRRPRAERLGAALQCTSDGSERMLSQGFRAPTLQELRSIRICHRSALVSFASSLVQPATAGCLFVVPALRWDLCRVRAFGFSKTHFWGRRPLEYTWRAGRQRFHRVCAPLIDEGRPNTVPTARPDRSSRSDGRRNERNLESTFLKRAHLIRSRSEIEISQCAPWTGCADKRRRVFFGGNTSFSRRE